MLQIPCKTLGFKKNMVYKIPPGGGGGGGKPYPASGLKAQGGVAYREHWRIQSGGQGSRTTWKITSYMGFYRE